MADTKESTVKELHTENLCCHEQDLVEQDTFQEPIYCCSECGRYWNSSDVLDKNGNSKE